MQLLRVIKLRVFYLPGLVNINYDNVYRKLKNRMSAQQARDRKKVYVTELEERIAQLEEEVCFLLDHVTH